MGFQASVGVEGDVEAEGDGIVCLIATKFRLLRHLWLLVFVTVFSTKFLAVGLARNFIAVGTA